MIPLTNNASNECSQSKPIQRKLQATRSWRCIPLQTLSRTSRCAELIDVYLTCKPDTGHTSPSFHTRSLPPPKNRTCPRRINEFVTHINHLPNQPTNHLLNPSTSPNRPKKQTQPHHQNLTRFFFFPFSFPSNWFLSSSGPQGRRLAIDGGRLGGEQGHCGRPSKALPLHPHHQ